ncbi:Mismatch repair endonuclease pms2 [Mortierella polycephala]|uniref:DNA mismatch repair protein PMS1 n=1 Tax=Mortierella polycephala TaxID=41804 RepID=A0A9P6PKH0_9FUNG|nr:Mismatch repair endonuclease pms2 [Mortierella polycephala]
MTTATNNSIRAIDKESVHRICSGQVVLDMTTAVKELIENSLDAGSTSIVIKFKQNGLEYITVTDNGSGISDANLETLALKHYTSKLCSFNDLAHVRSFGFRGEALSSLCALAQLTVTTSTGTTPTGVLVEYSANGTVKSKSPAPATKGTIVRISNLFEGMPVRRSEFVKNIKREYNKCIGLVQAYALIATNIKISCVSQTDKKPPVTYIASSGNPTIRQNIINVFGPKAMTDVIEFDLELVRGKARSSNGISDSSNDDEVDEDDDNQKGSISLTGYISSPSFGKGRSSADRQYLFINGRPCVLPKIARVINEVYHSFNTNQSPFLVANLILPTSYYDVNVSPDKRTIFLHNERMLVEALRIKLTEIFEPSRSTFAVSEARLLIKKPDLSNRLKTGSAGVDDSEADADENDIDRARTLKRDSTGSVAEPISLSSLSHSHSTKPKARATATTLTILEQSTLTDRFQTVTLPAGVKRKAVGSGSESENESAVTNDSRTGISRNSGALVDDKIQESNMDYNDNPTSKGTLSNSTATLSGLTMDVMEGYDPLDDKVRQGEEEPISDSEEEAEFEARKRQLTKPQRVVILDSRVHEDSDREWVEVGFDMQEHQRKRELRMKVLQETRRLEQERAALRKERAQKKLMEQQQRLVASKASNAEGIVDGEADQDSETDDPTSKGARRSHQLRSQKLSDANFANMDDVKAQKSLSRVISKGDFARMKILGQFNKAFIVARLDNYAALDPEHSNDTQPRKHRGERGTLISSDIFVIDQHASDEKYNFETLQAKTVFSTQRLFQPKKLHLTAQEEITVVDHMTTLNKNGFYLDYDPEAPVSHRLRLVTLPVSEKVIFDLQDFEELVFLLSQHTASSTSGCIKAEHSKEVAGEAGHYHGEQQEKMVRCSKVRAMFASRACRRSVMIGHVLNHSQMKRIVRHMGEIDQPWNCPHGRPTMRHLLDLAELEQQERRARHAGHQDDQDGEDGDYDEADMDLATRLLNVDRSGAFDPIAIKRPTRHQGSLFKQFIAVPPPQAHMSL